MCEDPSDAQREDRIERIKYQGSFVRISVGSNSVTAQRHDQHVPAVAALARTVHSVPQPCLRHRGQHPGDQRRDQPVVVMPLQHIQVIGGASPVAFDAVALQERQVVDEHQLEKAPLRPACQRAIAQAADRSDEQYHGGHQGHPSIAGAAALPISMANTIASGIRNGAAAQEKHRGQAAARPHPAPRPFLRAQNVTIVNRMSKVKKRVGVAGPPRVDVEESETRRQNERRESATAGPKMAAPEKEHETVSQADIDGHEPE